MHWILLANDCLGFLSRLVMEKRIDNILAHHREKGEKTTEGGEPRKTTRLEENAEKTVAFRYCFHCQ